MRHGLVRFALAGLVLLLAAALAAAWLVPPLLDWNRYRGEIAAFVSAGLGRAVTIEGPISLSLLPEPVMTAERVSVVGAGADGTTMAVAQLRVRLALGPLLSGRVDARELVLRGLDMHLPWPLAPDAFALHAPLWLSSISARVENGRLSVGSAAATKIDASLGLTPDTGSYAAAGTAEISGQKWHLSARLTRSGGDGTAGLDLSLDGLGPVQGLGARFSGQIAADGSLSGRIGGGGPDLSRLFAAPASPFRADGRLSIAAGLAVADQMTLDIAGSPARGAVSVRLEPAPRLDVSLAASRLDLDQWLPALLGAGQNRIVAGIPTGIDLSAEAATLAGGRLSGLRGSFELAPDRVTLRDVAARLPGDAQVSLDGEFRRPATGPLHFNGSASLASPDLRTTLAWVAGAGAGPVASLPSGVLRTADLRAGVSADLGSAPLVVLSALNGMVDQSHVQGTLTLRPAARLSVTAILRADRLMLDPWMPTHWGSLADYPGRLGQLDLDLQLHADAASLRGHALAPMVVDAALEQGKLTVRRFDVQNDGGRLVLSGSLTDAGHIADGKLDLATATDAAPGLLGAWLPAAVPLAKRLPRGALTLSVTASGPPEALGVRGSLDIGDLHVEAQPTINLPGGLWTGSLTLRHPGAPRLLEGIGLGGTASWLGDGSLSWVGGLSGSGPIWAPTRLASDGFDVTAGSLRANGQFSFDRTGPDRSGPPRLVGRLSAETLPLPLPYPRAPEPLPIQLLAGWQATVKLDAAQVLTGLSPFVQKLKTTVTLDSGVVRLDAITARLEQGALSGAGSFDASVSPPRLQADLALAGAMPPNAVFELPLDLSGGVVDASASFTASGYAPATLLATLSGTLQLSDRHGSLAGVSLGKPDPRLDDDALRDALSGGSTPFDMLNIAAQLANGALTVSRSDLSGDWGTAALSGLLDIAGRTAELRLAWRPTVTDPPEVALRLSGKLDKPVRAFEISDVARWRAEHPVVTPAAK